MAADAFATRNGGDAESAFIVAAILCFDEGAGVGTHAARQIFAHDGFLVEYRQIDASLWIEYLHKFRFVFVENNAGCAFDLTKFIRCYGGVTAGEDNFGRFVFAVGAAGECAGIAGCFSRDGAGVDNNFVGIGSIGDDLMARS